MTTNERLIQLMKERNLDTRPDPRINHDVDHIAQLLGVSRHTVLKWLAPPHWKKFTRMRSIYLEKLEALAE